MVLNVLKLKKLNIYREENIDIERKDLNIFPGYNVLKNGKN
jgi:hypothetical protein